jgi:hypothetical protein
LTYGRFFHYTRGMTEKPQITALIDEWKPRKSLAAEIGASIDIVHKWARSNRIPSEWQARVVTAAQRKGLWYVTAEWMLLAHEKQADAA